MTGIGTELARGHRCEICQGRRVIRPTRHRPFPPMALPIDTAAFETSMDFSYKEFPCPECSAHVPTDKVAIVEHFTETSIDDRLSEETQRRHVLHHAATMFIDRAIREGIVHLRKHSEGGGRVVWRTTIGVVSPLTTTTIQQRANQAGAVLAREAVRRGNLRMMRWAGERETIHVDTGARMHREALAEVLAEHDVKSD